MTRDTTMPTSSDSNRLTGAYTSSDADTRLRATLAAGTDPRPGDLPALIAQCRVEPDFFVRDMLTWALTRHPVEDTLPRLLDELHSPVPQAVAQALHTVSKIGDARAWPHITDAHLTSDDEETARTAWRTAAGLAPPGDRAALADRLTTQLGRGDRDLRRSLSRALLLLGDAARPALEAHTADTHRGHHARATLVLLDDADLSFDAAEYQTAAVRPTTEGHTAVPESNGPAQ